MSDVPTGLCVWTIGPQLVTLIWKAAEALGGGASLEEVHHWGGLSGFMAWLCFPTARHVTSHLELQPPCFPSWWTISQNKLSLP